jgi:hypothetical protein
VLLLLQSDGVERFGPLNSAGCDRQQRRHCWGEVVVMGLLFLRVMTTCLLLFQAHHCQQCAAHSSQAPARGNLGL